MARSKWIVANKKADFKSVALKYHISEIIARIIRNRDICEDKDISLYLTGTIEDLHDPHLLSGIDKASDIVKRAITDKRRIRIIGDYDVDGVCSSFILKSGLTHAGADVDVVLPERVKDGYGLNENLINQAHDDGIDMIMTCDNGIAAREQIKHAKSLGMEVVVTDHHEVPFTTSESGEKTFIIPPADALVDPKVDDSYPFPGICGAVVAYKFLQVLFGENRNEYLDYLLPFAAMATVCDVMELRDENRIIVKEGLKRIPTTSNEGLAALVNAVGLSGSKISCYHVGFVIGPCINATGRLESAERALRLFSCENADECKKMANELKGLNESRKTLTQKGVADAIEQIDTTEIKNNKVLVVLLPDCHESIVGIVAGKIREKYGRPTIVLTKTENGELKGSGRSTECYNMFDKLSEHKDLMTKFGGHKGAAGMSMPESSLIPFRKALNADCNLDWNDLVITVKGDMVMPLRNATMELVDELSILEPFGNGNSKPLFMSRNVNFINGKRMGKTKSFGKFLVTDEADLRYTLLYFGDTDEFDAFIKEKYGAAALDALYVQNDCDNGILVNIAYYPSVNSFRGNDSLQIIMDDYC